jgi:hypothetical protein
VFDHGVDRTSSSATPTAPAPAWVTVPYHGATTPDEHGKVDALAAALAAIDRPPSGSDLHLPLAIGARSESSSSDVASRRRDAIVVTVDVDDSTVVDALRTAEAIDLTK